MRTPAALGALTFFALTARPEPARANNPIADENSSTGTALPLIPCVFDPTHAVEGFAEKHSYLPGETLRIAVSAELPSVTVDIYRMGFYNHLGARLMPGATQTLNNVTVELDNCSGDPCASTVDCSSWLAVSSNVYSFDIPKIAASSAESRARRFGCFETSTTRASSKRAGGSRTVPSMRLLPS